MKYLTTIFVILFFQSTLMSQPKATILYFGDPMCSWCYGFSPELSKTLKTLNGTVDLQMVMGGLRPYNTQKMPELAEFLQHHWEEVGQRSGQAFKYDILQAKDIAYDTEPACRAVLIMRKLQPSQEFAYFKAVQKAFYADNKNTTDTQTFVDLAVQFGVDAKSFQLEFESEEAKEAIRGDFEYSASLGVRSFPTLLLQKGEEFYLLNKGYTKADQLIEKIKKHLE